MHQWSGKANLELPRGNQQNGAGVWDERKKELIQIKAVICPENKWFEETLDNKGIVRDIWDGGSRKLMNFIVRNRISYCNLLGFNRQNQVP